MSRKMTKIDQEIERRARERAMKGVQTFLDACTIFNQLKCTTDKNVIAVRYTVNGVESAKESINSTFWNESKFVPKLMVEELTTKYIPEELDAFLNEIEDLKNRVNDLNIDF